MISRLLIAALLVVGMFAVVQPASATQARTAERPRTTRRQAIRQMPILQRPDRPLHFYGNTVRRRYRRTAGW